MFVRDSVWQGKGSGGYACTYTVRLQQSTGFEQPHYSHRAENHLSRSNHGKGPLLVPAVGLGIGGAKVQ